MLPFAAVDLEVVVVLALRRESRRLEGAQCPLANSTVMKAASSTVTFPFPLPFILR